MYSTRHLPQIEGLRKYIDPSGTSHNSFILPSNVDVVLCERNERGEWVGGAPDREQVEKARQEFNQLYEDAKEQAQRVVDETVRKCGDSDRLAD